MKALVLALLLAGCTTPTIQDKARQAQIRAMHKCIQADRAHHWPNLVYYRDGIPPQCRRYR